MKPYFYDEKAGIVIYNGDCRDILPELEPVDLVIADPPYMGVIDELWDNQWDSDVDFLVYLSGVIKTLSTNLVSNGSIYCFASPEMAARVEIEMRRYLQVLNSIVWSKGISRQGAAGSGIDVTSLRKFWTAGNEQIIFAEKQNCESAKVIVIGDYLKDEFSKAKITNNQISRLFPSKNGGLTGCVSNWLNGANFPTKEQYEVMRNYLNLRDGKYLRREYEDLRREYEDLRRPFNIDSSMQWGNIWEFVLSRNRNGHPCEKPISLIKHMVTISSRQGNTILDPFMGSGTTLRAAKDLGRKAIGIELEEKYCEIAAKRLSQSVMDLNI